MIAVPILLWTVGPDALPWAVGWNVVMLGVTSLIVLLQHRKPAAIARAVVAVVGGSWAIEYIGSTTGIPFGHYHYTEALQPQVGGVPVLIPLAWLMMLPPAWAVAGLLVPHSRLGFIATAAAALTAWDLFLDPQMVAWQFWAWDEPGGYFGIPWQNFLGWFVSAALLTVLAWPPTLPALPLLWVYTLTWFLQTIGLGLFWGMPGPALVGCAGMGLFVVLAWRKLMAETAHPVENPEPA